MNQLAASGASESGVRALLTPQERNVLNLLSLGHTNKEIAATLRISSSTVKKHVQSLLRKLQVKNRVEAAVYAVEAVTKGDQDSDQSGMKNADTVK